MTAHIGIAACSAEGAASVDSAVYTEALQAHVIGWMRPEPADSDMIDRIIMTELVPGLTSPQQVTAFQRVIGAMKDRGCDAVVLGCTEIPLILIDANAPLPTLDSTRLLARAALKRAAELGGR